jgi:hypothetical protein
VLLDEAVFRARHRVIPVVLAAQLPAPAATAAVHQQTACPAGAQIAMSGAPREGTRMATDLSGIVHEA